MRCLWKDIEGVESLYQVSNLGEIRLVNKSGLPVISKTPNGYLSVRFNKNGWYKNVLIHRVVAIHFIPNPENKPCVNHIDFNRENNRADNLEWVTHKENIQHSVNAGRMKGVSGEKHWRTKLTEEDVIRMRELHRQFGYTMKELADIFQMSSSGVNDIILRKRWKNVK